MIREALRPWRHKLLVLASLLLVGFLTLIGIATQNTRERQGHVEKTFEVRNIHVDEALCAGHPHSTRCRHHALSLLKACLEYARCRHLVELTVEGKVPPGIRVRPPDEASDSNTSAPGTSNSSSENNETRGNPGTSAPGSSGAGHEPGAPNHTPPHAHPPSGGGHGQGSSPEPTTPTEVAREEEGPTPGSSTGQTAVECVQALDPGCVGKSISETAGGAAQGGREVAEEAVGGITGKSR